MTIIKEMVRTEGLGAFFKGLTPKILVVGPKLVFSYTLAQSLIPFFGKYGELIPCLSCDFSATLTFLFGSLV